MTYTIEDALEILAGVVPRAVNIKIDRNDQSLIRSLGNQVKKSVALTDRQLALAIKKIESYRSGLQANTIDVDQLLSLRLLRMPLREIDRTHRIALETTNNGKTPVIELTYPFSKKLAVIWDQLRSHIAGDIIEHKNRKVIHFNEKNLMMIVSAFEPHNFEITDDIRAIQIKIEELVHAAESIMPSVSIVDNKPVLKNVTKGCLEYFNTEFPEVNDENILIFLDRAKSCGIHIQNQEVTDLILTKIPDSPLNRLITCNDTRYRINPDKYDLDFVFESINTLGQWPALIILDDEKNAFKQVQQAYEQLKKYMPNEAITVFFRLDNGQSDYKEFNQFVRDNTLNNYIDSKTKVVFITKTRIPKPLYKADWHPRTAIVFPNYDFGKLSAYLNDFPSVYYYNNAIAIRHNRIKGTRQIVEL